MNAQPIEFLDLLNGQVQYVVPRWQRRYCWGQSDIERLIDDLLVIADAGPNATHYGGTLLTFPEPGAAGVVKVFRVVDGQQRLTTVSILLGCIAEKLGPSPHPSPTRPVGPNLPQLVVTAGNRSADTAVAAFARRCNHRQCASTGPGTCPGPGFARDPGPIATETAALLPRPHLVCGHPGQPGQRPGKVSLPGIGARQ